MHQAIGHAVQRVTAGQHIALQQLQVGIRKSAAEHWFAVGSSWCDGGELLQDLHGTGLCDVLFQNRGTCHNAVKLTGETLRSHQRLAPTARAAHVIRILRIAPVIGPNQGFGAGGDLIERVVTPINPCLGVQSERGIAWVGGLVAKITADHGVAIGQSWTRTVVAGAKCRANIAVCAAAAHELESAIPLLRQAQFEACGIPHAIHARAGRHLYGDHAMGGQRGHAGTGRAGWHQRSRLNDARGKGDLLQGRAIRQQRQGCGCAALVTTSANQHCQNHGNGRRHRSGER